MLRCDACVFNTTVKSMICLPPALLPEDIWGLLRPSLNQSPKAMIMSGMSSTTDPQSLANGTPSRILAPCAFIPFVYIFKDFWCVISLIILADTGPDYRLLLTQMIPIPILNQRMRLMKTLTVCFYPMQPCNFAKSTRLFAEEEYYKNDYPEDENSSENDSNSSGATFAMLCDSSLISCLGLDMFHEQSDREEILQEDDSFDEREWR